MIHLIVDLKPRGLFFSTYFSLVYMNFLVHACGRLVQLVDFTRKEVLNILCASEAIPIVSDNLVRIHEQIEAIVPLLDKGSNDIRFIMIYSMGSIGKTTLAKSIFKKIFSNFQGSCFLSNV